MKLPESPEDGGLQNPPKFRMGLRNMCVMLELAALALLQMGNLGKGDPSAPVMVKVLCILKISG